jgi:hypothetical protein
LNNGLPLSKSVNLSKRDEHTVQEVDPPLTKEEEIAKEVNSQSTVQEVNSEQLTLETSDKPIAQEVDPQIAKEVEIAKEVDPQSTVQEEDPQQNAQDPQPIIQVVDGGRTVKITFILNLFKF